MSQLTNKDEGPNGYLIKKKPRAKPKPPTNAQRRRFFAMCDVRYMGNLWPEGQLEAEQLDAEQCARAQLAAYGTIGVESGTHAVENFYSIFGWEGGTYPGMPCIMSSKEYVNVRNSEDYEREQRSLEKSRQEAFKEQLIRFGVLSRRDAA